jgi:hypothetical protein
MNKKIALLLTANILFLCGCSTNRTLEWKDGKLSMTEEQRWGKPPLKWDLKEVSSIAEVKMLRQDGWRPADGTIRNSTIKRPGGSDTFLVKRRADPQATVVLGTPPPFHTLLITTFGSYLTQDVLKIDVSENSIDFTHTVSGGIGISGGTGMPGWKARPGWFVFIESPSKVWACDGNNLLWLYLETHAERSSGYTICPGRFRVPGFESGYPCAVPAEVISQLPKQMQIQKQN